MKGTGSTGPSGNESKRSTGPRARFVSVLKMRTALMGKHVTLELKYVLMLLKFQVISSTMEIREMEMENLTPIPYL